MSVSLLQLKPKRVRIIHLIGIKGVGMAGLAQILKARGFRVSGSDTHEKFFTDEVLRRLKIPVQEGFRASNVPKDAALVIVSTAYLKYAEVRLLKFRKSDFLRLNPEVREALRRKIPILTYPEAVEELFNNAFGIAVAGSHGKSTTTAMIGVMLEKLGADPDVLVGAEALNWNTNARTSHMPYAVSHKQKKNVLRPTAYGLRPFVLEADEYRNAFLRYQPHIIVMTGVEWDHPDVFKTPRAYRRAFERFMRKLRKPGMLIYCGDDAAARMVARNRPPDIPALSYGAHARNAVRVSDISVNARGTSFSISYKGRLIGSIAIGAGGHHHAVNAAAAVAVGLSLGYSPYAITRALSSFKGLRRRFEILNPKCLATRARCPVIIDDYAHHPTEIQATLAAAREAFPRRRLMVLFQPHTYSRTKAFFSDFVAALRRADLVFLLNTYGSAREQQGRVGSEALAQALAAPHFPDHQTAIAHLSRTLRPDDVLLALGAGDQWQIGKALANCSQTRYTNQ